MLAALIATAASTAAPLAPTAGSVPLAPAATLAIVHDDPLLNATAAIIARVVTRKSGCAISPAAAVPGLTLALAIDRSLGPEAYAATFDGQHSATIRGGDRMGVTFGAGAFLRGARFGPAGLTPPQPLPPPPPPPPPAPLVPIGNQWWAGEANRSYDYGACGPGPKHDGSPGGCALSPLLGIVDTFEDCKRLCLATNLSECSSNGWPGLWQVPRL